MSGVISAIPMSFTLAGEAEITPGWTFGGYCFFGAWPWTVVGPGTLFAMFYVGFVVRSVNPHMGWFDRLLAFRPGFRRYIYGLARFIYPKK